MGHMKYIYDMVETGSYASFKKLYENAEKSGVPGFIWASEAIDTEYAKRVCEYVDNYLMQKYEDHLENMIDNYYEQEQ